MKFIDNIFNSTVIYIQRLLKIGNPIYWENISFIKWFLMRRLYLRADYIEYTAKTYSHNVQSSVKCGYLPIDYNHLKESYWLNELNKNQTLLPYLGKNAKELK